MAILFVSSLAPGGTCEMRRQALERLGHRTLPYSYYPAFHRYASLLRKSQWHLRIGPALRKINTEIMERLEAGRPDLLWIEKGWFVWPATLKHARKLGVRRAVLYSPDNYLIKQNNSRHLWRGLPSYDLVVTTKTSNVECLKTRGAREVLLSGNAYDPCVHVPVKLAEHDRSRFDCDVSFIGRWEPQRERWLESVARLGVRLFIWGFRWERARSPLVRVCYRGGPALQHDYAKAIAGSKINLCFLSRVARDTITQRSVEIPACAGFMLAERTAEHTAHFKEGVEAAYFTTLDEMLQHILYYLDHDAERSRIRWAARERCIRSGYSYNTRVTEILNKLDW